MESNPVNIYFLLAEAFGYPVPGLLAILEKELETLPANDVKLFFTRFMDKIRSLALGEWEELYTSTFDLNPPAPPYIGFQVWGESYKRGEFLSKMSRELMKTNINSQGELPDHLIPVLRYLGQVSNPLPDLVEVLDSAIQNMTAGLRKADSANPYLELFEAVRSHRIGFKKEPA